MSTVPENTVAGGSSAPPVAWWSAASPVGGDVVLSGVVLLFAALAFAFVLYHYFTVKASRCRRRGGTHQAQEAEEHVTTAPSSAQQRGTLAGGGGLGPSVLRALPVTVYEAKDRPAPAGEGEELECAVCLAELADGEAACRFLPRCAHGFHAECIDLWLRAHSTCPLCRVNVDVDLLPAATLLPPALPEPANYYPTTNLPTNVLFWGSSLDAVTVAARTTAVHGGQSGPAPASGGGGSPPPLVIHVREETAPAVAPPEAAAAREDEAAKAQGLARLSSLRRLWSRREACMMVRDAAAAMRPPVPGFLPPRHCRGWDGTAQASRAHVRWVCWN